MLIQTQWKKDQSTCQNSDFVNKKGEVQEDHIGNEHSQTLAENEEGFHLYVQHNFVTILKKKISTSSVIIVVISQKTKCFTWTELYGGLTFGSHWIFLESLDAVYMCGIVGLVDCGDDNDGKCAVAG